MGEFEFQKKKPAVMTIYGDEGKQLLTLEIKDEKLVAEYDFDDLNRAAQIFVDQIVHRFNRTIVIPSHRPRLISCVQRWPECAEGEFHPSCCRFPKSCSCTVYPDGTPVGLLEAT